MARQFADVLRELAGGVTYEELTTGMGDLVQQVLETGKGGTLTLKLTITPNGEHSVFVRDDLTIKTPSKKRPDTIFYATSSGSLVREDPRQEKLPLRTVVGAEPERAPAAVEA